MKLFMLWCSLFLAGTALGQASISLSVSPTAQSVTLGSPVSFDINISGLGNGTALGTYDIVFGFDPTVFSYSSVSFGNQVDIFGLGDIQSVTAGSGAIDVFELSLDSPSDLNALQASSFTLAALTLNTLSASSNSSLTLSINALGDAFGNSISASTGSGSVTVNAPVAPASPVPEPSTLLSVVTGLVVILAARFRLSGSSSAYASLVDL